MQLTNFQIINAAQHIQNLGTKELPAATAFKVARLMGTLTPIVAEFDKARFALIDRFGKKDEGGKFVEQPAGKIVLADAEGFKAEFDPLLACSTEVTFAKIKLEELHGVKLTPEALVACEWMFDFGGETADESKTPPANLRKKKAK